MICVPFVHANAQTSSEEKPDEVNIWRLCPAAGLQPILEPAQSKPLNGQLLLDADSIESQGDTVTKLKGNVSITSDVDLIHADNAVYRLDEQKMELDGNVQYRSDQFEFNADSMISVSAPKNMEVKNADFFIPINHGNGTAETVIRQGEDITNLKNLTYTTCQPDDRLWYFKAKEMKLDHSKGMGLAKHMTLRIKDVPVLYFPALSFPIDDRRKSGFLFPTVGDSSRHGVEFELPYYWNIAPQADATITPHYMHERGLKLDTEWRYLNSWSTNTIEYQYLDDDLYGGRRSSASLTHSGRFATYWSTSIRGAEISDTDYLMDFGTSLNTTSITHLAQSAALTGQWNQWRLVTRLLSYQTVDETISQNNEPYSLRPNISLSGYYPDIGLDIELELESSYTVFEHNNKTSGNRFDFRPRISRPFGNSGWFVIPAISSRFTSYNLDRADLPTEQNNEIRRSIPTVSIDSGLIFERMAAENDTYLQTFEPRIFYLRTPFREQENIPVFDTRQPAFGMYQLYEENRFAGIDRIGDANQAALSFTNRWLRRDTGAEQFRASLGQVYYFDDRKVSLWNTEIATDKRSGILAEISTSFASYWSSSLNLEWNPVTKKTDKGLFRLRYNQHNRYLFNVGYRYHRDTDSNNQSLEQADISLSLPVGNSWSVIGRWNHSIEEKLDLDKYFGFEYESCCWAFRIMGREFLLPQNTSTIPGQANTREFDKSIYFEVIFKGLARSGGSIGQRLEQNISGYRDPFE